MESATAPLRVLFLCTQNSARSQIAEGILNARRDQRVVASSAGTQPAPTVNPFAVELLNSLRINPSEAHPKHIDEVIDEPWDLVITVCDSARESCPILPGRPSTAHWGIPDPAAVEGDDETKRRAFAETAFVLGRRIDLLLSLPLDKLRGLALQTRARDIAEEVPPKHGLE
jgi:arsenate reductase (thioredoxin)